MEKQSIFAGKNIKLLNPYYKIRHIIFNENGELKNGEGKVLDFGKDYILIEGEPGDTYTRVFDNDDILLIQFKSDGKL